MKYTKQQIIQVTAAVLFLIGAIFMLVNTFADQAWSFWTGLGFAVVAAAVYIYMFVENRKLFSKKLTESSYSDKSNNTIEHEKNVQNPKNQTPETKS
jgi:Ca2+/Na+ antiporter